MIAKPEYLSRLGDPLELPFETGDHLDQPTFHRLYEQTPEGFKAELIRGIVYVASPTSSHHGGPHARAIVWIGVYSSETVGTDVMDNTTNIIGPEDEPQPDGFLIVLPECGGQTTIDEKGYIHGPAELVVEVANSSRAIDLNAKRDAYELAGVREYVVFEVKGSRVHWFVRRESRFEELKPGTDGVFRSEVFPGLWLHSKGFFAKSSKQLMGTLRKGLASEEHAEFVKTLTARRKPKSRRKS